MQRKLTLVVCLAVCFSALAISAALFFHNQRRSYRDTVQRSEEMVDAASLAFSRALAAGDEVLLDALVHELKSHEELHIREVYVLDTSGRVAAHSRVEEYGKTFPLPALLKQSKLERLSQATTENGSYQVVSVLQQQGMVAGALVATFSTEHLSEQIRSEMIWNYRCYSAHPFIVRDRGPHLRPRDG